MNRLGRGHGCGYILALAPGVSGVLFVDFGEAHKVSDPNTQLISQYVVKGIQKGELTTVILDDDSTTKINYYPGDHVKFTEVKGMTEINAENRDEKSKLIKIKRIKFPNLELELDSRGFSDYEMNGFVENVKVPVTVNHESFSASYLNP